MLRMKIGVWSAIGIAALVVVVVGCSSAGTTTGSGEPGDGAAAASDATVEPVVVREEPYILQSVPEFTIEITSKAVNRTGRLNKYYTCEGVDASPDLSWTGVPEEAQSLVFLMVDPATDEVEEEGVLWTHWVLYSLPPTVTELPEALPATETLENGAKHGVNDYGNAFYSGPCPEPTTYVAVQGCRGTGSGCGNAQTIPAKVRDYYFYLYALDKDLDLAPGATRNEVLQEIEGHIIGAGEFVPDFRSTATNLKR